jgi:hypothetical protein
MDRTQCEWVTGDDKVQHCSITPTQEEILGDSEDDRSTNILPRNSLGSKLLVLQNNMHALPRVRWNSQCVY